MQDKELDRLIELVYAESLMLFEGNEPAMGEWFNNPLKALGAITPADSLGSSADIEKLRLVIGRLEHGIPT